MANYNRTIDDFGRVVEWENLRDKYKPPIPIKLLLVGESPPKLNTGRFFYEVGPLTRHTKAAFASVYPNVDGLSDSEFLCCFKKIGCYLDDITLKPVAGMDYTTRNYTLLKELPDLIDRLKQYRPKAVVSIVKRTGFFVKYAVEKVGLDLEADYLPFPAHRQRNIDNFVERMSKILSREIKRGSLSKECCNS